MTQLIELIPTHTSLSLQRLPELAVKFIEFHLDPEHVNVVFVLQAAHVVDIARKREVLLGYHEPEVEQPVEKGVFEEIPDLIYQVPVE